jgi:hypothetical protein
MNLSEAPDVEHHVVDALLGRSTTKFALYCHDPYAAVVKHYLLNTDRLRPFSLDEFSESVELFRGYLLRRQDQVSEFAFAVYGIVHIAGVQVIIYTKPEVTFILRRLGFVILGLRGGSPGGSVYRNGSHQVHCYAGVCTPEPAGTNHPYALVNVNVRGSFRYGPYAFRSVQDPERIEVFKEPLFPGVATSMPPFPDVDFLVDSDEIIPKLLTSDIGLCYNGRRLQSPSIAGFFGSGRLGAFVREIQSGDVISCGDRGESVIPLVRSCRTYIAVDLNYPSSMWSRVPVPIFSVTTSILAEITGAFDPSELPTHGLPLADYFALYTPCLGVLDADGPVRSPKAYPGIYAAPPGSGKSMLCREFGFTDGDSLVTWPDPQEFPRWWDDAEFDAALKVKNGKIILEYARMHPTEVILTYIEDIADTVVVLPEELHRRLLSHRREAGENQGHDWTRIGVEAARMRSMVHYDSWECLWRRNPHPRQDPKRLSIWGAPQFVQDMARWYDSHEYCVIDEPGVYPCVRVFEKLGQWYGLISDRNRIRITSGFMMTRFSWTDQLLFGRFLRADIFSAPVINHPFHMLCLFSISNVVNGPKFWRRLMEARKGPVTFNAMMPSAVRAYKGKSRVSVRYERNVVYATSAGGDWMDYWVDPTTVVAAFPSLTMLSFKDYAAWKCTMQSSSEPVGPMLDGLLVILGGGRSNASLKDVLVALQSGKHLLGVDGATFTDVRRAYAEGVLAPGWGLHKRSAQVDPTAEFDEWESWIVIETDELSTSMLREAYSHYRAGGRMLRHGDFGPVNANDEYLNLWAYYTTDKLTTFPDQLNTQTWVVKVPTVTIRRVLQQSSIDQHLLRRRAIEGLSAGARALYSTSGHWVGYLPEYDIEVDISGHAISMLLAATYGFADIHRYWNTVGAMVGEAFNSKKSPEYKALLAAGNVTEDATRAPFTLWHTYWDYRGAVGAYVIYCQAHGLKLNVMVMRSSLKKLNALRRQYPKFSTLRRAGLRRGIQKYL